LWGSAVWCLAAGLARTFDRTGWFYDIGEVESPISSSLTSKSKGTEGPASIPATDAPITDSEYLTLIRFGLIPLRQILSTDRAMCFDAPSLYQPTDEEGGEAGARPDLLSMVAICRVGHNLRCLIRERQEPFWGIGACERVVRNWLASYVVSSDLGETSPANCPLISADVAVQADSNDPTRGWHLVLTVAPKLRRTQSQSVSITIPLAADRIVVDSDTRGAESTLDRFGAMAVSPEQLEPVPKTFADDGVEARLAAMATSDRSGREKFVARLLLAERAVQAGKFEFAGAILEDLAEQIERFRLHEWESPRLVVRVWKLLRHVYLSTPGRNDAHERSTILLRRICSLDPAAAVE
jgi:hypothetical protein